MCVGLVSRYPIFCSLSRIQWHICIVMARNKSILFSHVRERRRSVVNNFKVAIVVSLSLHHQPCDNFRTIQQEKAKWTGSVMLYAALHCLDAPLGPSLKACTTLRWVPEGHVHCEDDGVWTCWPDTLWKIFSSSEAFEDNELLDAWHLDVGRSGCRCDTPGSSFKPPSYSELLVARGPCFVTLVVPNQFRYPI